MPALISFGLSYFVEDGIIVKEFCYLWKVEAFLPMEINNIYKEKSIVLAYCQEKLTSAHAFHPL